MNLGRVIPWCKLSFMLDSLGVDVKGVSSVSHTVLLNNKVVSWAAVLICPYIAVFDTY